MRTTVVIPTYWSRENNEWHEGDAVYDHPTPINGDDTLGRTLESMKDLKDKEFKLVIPICPTADDIEDEAEARVREIIRKVDLDIETYIFTQRNLRDIQKLLMDQDCPDTVCSFLSLKGYSNVRNICLYVSHILASDVTILIDDDEIFENKSWINYAKEFIGKRMYGKTVFGVAGYYLNKRDEFYDDVSIEPWMTYWNRFGSKTKAFDKIIACEPRLKVTPFAFGGAMIIHKNMYQIVPFDPKVTRGEDMDYLLNAKMYGFDFFLDNKLGIKHLPPKKNHPVWKRFREDIYRFLYEKTKIDSQYEVNNMTRVTASHFDPYPGDFLKDDLEDKIYKTNIILALEYLARGDIEGCRESINNIFLSKYEAIPHDDPFTNLRRIQKNWVKLINKTRDFRMPVRKILEKNNLTKEAIQIDRDKYKYCTPEDLATRLKAIEGFEGFSDAEIASLAKITHIDVYDENEMVFKEGSKGLSFQVIQTGCVRIVKFDENGEEIPMANLCTGDILGETFLLKDAYNMNCIANEVCEIITMGKEDLLEIIDNEGILGKKLLYLFLDRLYYKLNKTNALYRENIVRNEQISSMN